MSSGVGRWGSMTSCAFMATFLRLALSGPPLSLARRGLAGYSRIVTSRVRVTYYSLQRAFRKAPMSEAFYRMKRLPPSVIAEVNAMRDGAPAVGEDITDVGVGHHARPPHAQVNPTHVAVG